jgi:hypothetical protein
MTGAAIRAVLVAVLIAMPGLILPGSAEGNTDFILLLALFAAGFVFVEYASVSPSLVEFREAPPFNRTRFFALFLTVLTVSLILRDIQAPSATTGVLFGLGIGLGEVMDFAYSPVRLLVVALASGDSPESIYIIRTVAGVAFSISLASLALFLAALRLGDWPVRSGAFNVWINLPTFDPTTGGDIVDRLQGDGRLNIGMGICLPFLLPVALHLSEALLGLVLTTSAQALVWIVAGWSFVPLSLLMRGIAMTRLANMIVGQRRRDAIEGPEARIFAL